MTIVCTSAEKMECDDEELMESSCLPQSPSSHQHNILIEHIPLPQPSQTGLSLLLTGGSPSSQPQSRSQGAEVVDLYKSPCSPQISLSEYNAQAGDYTQQALRELRASPEYKRHIQRCHRFIK